MKRFGFIIAAVPVFASILYAGETKLGKPLTVAETSTINELLTHPEKYVGRDVRIEGEIIAVCQNAGCWIEVRDSSSSYGVPQKLDRQLRCKIPPLC
jgi:hypothetical protein